MKTLSLQQKIKAAKADILLYQVECMQALNTLNQQTRPYRRFFLFSGPMFSFLIGFQLTRNKAFRKMFFRIVKLQVVNKFKQYLLLNLLHG